MPSRNLQPALLGGLFIGVLSALPIINFANCCCLWVIGGGLITAYLIQSSSAVAITISDGALGGLMAGIFGAVIDAILSLPIRLMMGSFQQRVLQRWMESAPDVPDSVRGLFEPGLMGGRVLLSVIANLFIMLVVGAIFATIGGMLGAAIFRGSKPAVLPAAPPPPPPPPPYPPQS